MGGEFMAGASERRSRPPRSQATIVWEEYYDLPNDGGTADARYHCTVQFSFRCQLWEGHDFTRAMPPARLHQISSQPATSVCASWSRQKSHCTKLAPAAALEARPRRSALPSSEQNMLRLQALRSCGWAHS